jgi:hypothetical protein
MYHKITVDPKSPIKFSPIFEIECEEVTVASCNETSLKIETFCFNDIQVIECPNDKLRGTEFLEHLIVLGYVPLNALHANAINSQEHISKVHNLVKRYFWRKDFKLETVNFLGTIGKNSSSVEQIYCFKFDNYKQPPLFMAFDDEPGWSSSRDLAFVFKKTFVKEYFTVKKTKK